MKLLSMLSCAVLVSLFLLASLSTSFGGGYQQQVRNGNYPGAHITATMQGSERAREYLQNHRAYLVQPQTKWKGDFLTTVVAPPRHHGLSASQLSSTTKPGVF